MKKYTPLLTFLLFIAFAVPAFAIQLNNPLGNVNNINQLLVNLIKAILGIVGAVSLAVFVYGGVMMLISAGKPDMVKKGQNALFWATIGLVIIFSSYGLTESIFKLISGQGL